MPPRPGLPLATNKPHVTQRVTRGRRSREAEAEGPVMENSDEAQATGATNEEPLTNAGDEEQTAGTGGNEQMAAASIEDQVTEAASSALRDDDKPVRQPAMPASSASTGPNKKRKEQPSTSPSGQAKRQRVGDNAQPDNESPSATGEDLTRGIGTGLDTKPARGYQYTTYRYYPLPNPDADPAMEDHQPPKKWDLLPSTTRAAIARFIPSGSPMPLELHPSLSHMRRSGDSNQRKAIVDAYPPDGPVNDEVYSLPIYEKAARDPFVGRAFNVVGNLPALSRLGCAAIEILQYVINSVFDIRTRMNAMQSELGQLRGEITALKEARDRNRARLRAVTQELHFVNTSIEEIRARFNRNTRRLTTQLDDLYARDEARQSEIDALNRRISALTSRPPRRRQQIDVQRPEVEDQPNDQPNDHPYDLWP